MTTPDLPYPYLDLWKERAALMHEGNRLPDTTEGHDQADRMALVDVRKSMMRERIANGT